MGKARSRQLTIIVLGAVVLLLVLAVLLRWPVPIVTRERSAMLVLLVLGATMCAQGIGQVAEYDEWLHPLSLVAYAVGLAILVVGGFVLLGRRPSFLNDARQAFFVVSGLIAVKVALTTFHNVLRY